MFESSTVRARVYTDETGLYFEIPVLLTAAGPVTVLVDYFLDHWDTRSSEWMVKVASSVRLFLDYLDAHPGYPDARTVFQNFRHRLLTGTVDAASATDPSSLWWSARGPRDASRIITNLTDFFNWWAERNPGKRNPVGQWHGSAHDVRLAEAAYEFRRNAAFLGHTWSSFHETSRKPGSKSGFGRPPKSEEEQPPAFPESRILDLILKGFRVGKRFNYRDMLITLLLNGAGFRESEPFHLYLFDVSEDPVAKGQALVLIHHPSWGDAPVEPAWVDVSGKPRGGRRSAYLFEKYGLAPRDWGLSTSAAGWKGGMHESKFGGYYKQAYWFVPEFGELFLDIWHLYMEQVQRIKPSLRPHPFAFMNTQRAPVGALYKMGKFEDSHAAAVRRIGLIPAKHLGTSIHGHRHAYAQRLRKAGVSEDMIRRFMHHTDIRSQRVYTGADRAECVAAITNAMARLSSASVQLREQIVKVDSSAVPIVLRRARN